MPLKHLTETILIVVLAAVTALAAFAVSVLPPLPGGVFPWGVLLALMLMYPLALYGLFRAHRADKALRLLHFAPAAIVVLWLLLQLVRARAPQAGALSEAFTWLHGAGPVLLVYALIAAFCLHVIRRRFPRLTALGLLAAAFVGIAFVSVSRGWDHRLQAGVVDLAERAGFAPTTGTGSRPGTGTGMIAQNPVSSRPAGTAVSSARRAASSAMRAASSAASSRPLLAASASSAPPRLPSSGLGAEGLATAMMAGYCSVLHIRARRRMA